MEAARVLDKGTLPCDGESQEEGVQAGIIEPLADETARRHHDPLLRFRDLREVLGRLPTCLRAAAAFQYDDIPGHAPKAIGEELDMVPPLREDHG